MKAGVNTTPSGTGIPAARIWARRYALLPQFSSRDTSLSKMMPFGVRRVRHAFHSRATSPLTHNRCASNSVALVIR